MKHLLVVICVVLGMAAVDAMAHSDTNLVMEITGNQRARIVKEMQDNWNDLARGTGALTNGLTVIGNVAVTGTVTATSIDAGSVTDITFADGQVLDSADTTNVTITGAERALSEFRIVGGGTTNVAADNVNLVIQGNDIFGTNTDYLAIDTDFTDTTPGSEDATVTITIPVAGTDTTMLTLDSGGVTLGEATTVNSTFNQSNAVFRLNALQTGTNGLVRGGIYYESLNGTNTLCIFGM